MHFLETLGEILVSREATSQFSNSSQVWPDSLDLERATLLIKRTLPIFGTSLRVNLRANLRASLKANPNSPKKMLPSRTSPRINHQRRRRG